jgi:KaiC/GvpD/RAD55 family RecA-like ATPase
MSVVCYLTKGTVRKRRSSSPQSTCQLLVIHSGIAPLDQQLGGVFPGRLHMLTGGPGTGKTTAGLHFLHTGLRKGDAVGLLTLDRLSDLASHARSIGLDLEPALRAGRLVLLRFRLEFTSLLPSAVPARVIDDLRRLIGVFQPARLVVDPLTPFLADGSASGAALTALAQFLDELDVTAMLSYPADVSAGYDARLDPIAQRAAAIVHFEHGDRSTRRMRIVQARPCVTPPRAVRFVIKPGIGFVTVASDNPLTELDDAATNGAASLEIAHPS